MESWRLYSADSIGPLRPINNRDETRHCTPLHLRWRLFGLSFSHLPLGRPRSSRLAIYSCYSGLQENSSATSIDDLRRQLEALNLEAEQARGRANAARARFMRLTETVENLRIRAITDLKSGREANARQSISEKQKVMQALDKSKQRAELLEELCGKLGEAISSKELQVIALLSSTNVGVDESSTTLNVRIVSPKAEALAPDQAANTKAATDSVRGDVNGRVDAFNNNVGAENDALGANDQTTDAVTAMLSSRGQMYPEFLLGIDNYLHVAEVDLHGFLNIAAMIVPEDVDKFTKEKVNVVRQIYHDVRLARGRIKKAVPQEE